jgi:uncharacterized protein (TIGR02246 family)
MDAKQELDAVIEARIRAVRAKDLEGTLRLYAEDVVAFDLVAPLEHRGRNGLKSRLETWFASFATNIDYELRDITLSVSGDVAFDHHLTHVHATNTSEQVIDMWFRESIGYRRVNGHWLVVHQHSSVPMNMTNGQADITLRP